MQGKLSIWNASSYSQNSELQYQASKKLLSSHAFIGNERVLDIGCGHGRLTNEVAELIPEGSIIGIDKEQSMIEYARNHYPRKNLEFTLMDAQQFSFPYKFDVIISTFCIQWIPDKKLLLQNISEHLKENGYVLLIMPLMNKEIAEIRNNLMQHPTWVDYFRNYCDPQLVVADSRYLEYAREANLSDIQYFLETVKTRFKNAAKLTSFFRNITPCLTQLPDQKLQNDFMDALVQQYLMKHPIEKDGSCNISYTYAQLRANSPKKYCTYNNSVTTLID